MLKYLWINLCLRIDFKGLNHETIYVPTDDPESSTNFQLFDFLLIDTKKAKVYLKKVFPSKMFQMLKAMMYSEPYFTNGIWINIDSSTKNPDKILMYHVYFLITHKNAYHLSHNGIIWKYNTIKTGKNPLMTYMK